MFKWSNFSGSLLVRSVYLITLPIVLVQVVGIIIFFELHWDLVLKRSAQSIANEIKILELREITGWKVPIFVKIAGSRPYYDTALAVKAGADVVVLDGMQGGTAATQEVFIENVGQPTLACIRPAVDALLDLDMRLGEASGAAVALLIVKAALATHNGMATFDQAGVSSNE